MQKKYLPQWFNAGLFIFALVLSLNINWSKDDWKNLTDPYDYLHQSQISLFSKEFYFPHKQDDFDPRPFTVPLFYKLCGGNPDAIVQMQKLILWLSGFFMVAAFMLYLEKNSAKYLLAICVYLLLSWWNVLGWTTLVLSESLSMSLLFIWLASFLFALQKDKALWWVLHAVIVVLFAFTRDSWPYTLIAFYTGLCAMWIMKKQAGVQKFIALLLLCVAIFVVQQAGARAGHRSDLPVINSIVVRIIPNPAYTRWFVEHGMPDAEKLKQNFDSLDVVPEAGQHRLWALYADTAYAPFLKWVAEKGQPVYTRFLATHPAFVLFANETPAQRARIMSHDLFYIDEPRGYSQYISDMFPLFNISVVLVLCFILGAINTRRKILILWGPLVLAAFTLANAVLSYNADALEVERHLFITNILIQLTGFWAVALMWDSLTWRKRS